MLVFTKAINTIARCTMQYRSDKLSESQISGPQATYLIHVCHHPGITQDELAKAIYVNKSNVTRQLALLEKSSYVERRFSQADQRVIHVYPTQKAQELLPEIYIIFRDWNAYLTHDLSKEEKELFFHLLQKITKNAKQYVDEKQSNTL